MSENPTITARLGINISAFQQGLTAAQRKVAEFAQHSGGAGGMIAGVFKGATSAVGLFSIGVAAAIKGVMTLAKRADDVADKAQAVGVSTDFIQGWTELGRRAELSMEDAQAALVKFAEGIGKAQIGLGQRGMGRAMKELGIEMEDASGQIKSTEALLYEYADALASVEDPQKRLTLATMAFGDKAAELMPILNGGAASIRGIVDSASKMDKETVDRWATFWGSIKESRNPVLNTVTNLAAKVGSAPMIAGELAAKGVGAVRDPAESDEDYAARVKSELMAKTQARRKEEQRITAEIERQNQIVTGELAKGQKALAFEAMTLMEKQRALTDEAAEQLAISQDAEKTEQERVAAAREYNRLTLEAGRLLKQHTQELAKQAEAEAKAKQKPATKPARAARAAGLDGLQTVEGAMADASKLSLSELAVLGLNERGLDSGMSDQSEQARRVLKLKREAEGSRVSGDFGGAMAKSQEAYGIQQGLTALKESERDPYSGLKAALESARLNVAIDDAQLKTLTKGGTFQ